MAVQDIEQKLNRIVFTLRFIFIIHYSLLRELLKGLIWVGAKRSRDWSKSSSSGV